MDLAATGGVVTAPSEARERTIQRFASEVRHGRLGRDGRYADHGVDITAEVLAAAGPEQADEHVLYEREQERRFPWRLSGAIQEILAEELELRFSHHYCGEQFDADLDEDDEEVRDYLVLIRRRDGKRFHIEVSVDVQDLS